jgi:acetate kinase
MPQISYKTNADSIEESMSIANHKIGLEKIAALLMDRNTGVINSTQDIDVVGHRVVHGGASFSNPVHVDEMVEENHTAFPVGTAHNPANLEGIHVASAILHRQNKWLFLTLLSIKQFL